MSKSWHFFAVWDYYTIMWMGKVEHNLCTILIVSAFILSRSSYSSWDSFRTLIFCNMSVPTTPGSLWEIRNIDWSWQQQCARKSIQRDQEVLPWCHLLVIALVEDLVPRPAEKLTLEALDIVPCLTSARVARWMFPSRIWFYRNGRIRNQGMSWNYMQTRSIMDLYAGATDLFALLATILPLPLLQIIRKSLKLQREIKNVHRSYCSFRGNELWVTAPNVDYQHKFSPELPQL